MMKLYSLQWLRAWAALVVVFYHVGVISQMRGSLTFAENIFRHGHVGVDLFFVLSGFIIVYIHQNDLGRVESLKGYYLKRFVRIWPLLFVLTSVKLGYGLLLGAENYGAGRMNGEVILASYFMLPVSESLGGKPLIGVAWTLSHEMLFYLLFGFGIVFGKRVLWGLMIVWLGGIGVYSVVASETNEALKFLFSGHNIQFVMGVSVGWILKSRHAQFNTWVSALIFGAGGVLLLLGMLGVSGVLVGQGLNSYGYYGLASACIILGLVSMEKRGISFQGRGVLLGDASYSIYLIHSSIQVLLWVIWRRFMYSEEMNVYEIQGSLWGIGLCSVLGGVLCYLYVERPLLQWSRRIIPKKT